ncbi:MAG: CPBP family intramembrane glutamic endopeptidase [Planctomycetaceae bacterium]
MPDLSNRRQFLALGALCEGVLILLAFALGWLAGINPLEHWHLHARAVAWGVVGMAPLLVLFLTLFYYPIGPLQQIKRFLVSALGPALSTCRWYDLLALALLVGFSEELLFRGVLQPWMSGRGTTIGVLASNVIFGLAHFVTPLYALIAGVMGVYLAALMQWNDGNLTVPAVTHAVYDYLAFLFVARAYRREQLMEEAQVQPPT